MSKKKEYKTKYSQCHTMPDYLKKTGHEKVKRKPMGKKGEDNYGEYGVLPEETWDLGVTILVYINRHLNVYLKDSTNDRLNSWKYTIPVWTHSGKSEYKEDTTLKECIQIIIKYIDDFLNSGLDMIEYRRSCEKVKVALEILGIIFPALGWH